MLLANKRYTESLVARVIFGHFFGTKSACDVNIFGAKRSYDVIMPGDVTTCDVILLDEALLCGGEPVLYLLAGVEVEQVLQVLV